jgi:tellurite resistance protein
MSSHPENLQHLSFNWFAIVMGVAGLSLAWLQAMPMLGDTATGVALVLAGVAALAFVALAVLSWIRWQVQAEAVAAELAHPARHAFLGAVPVSVLLLATAGCRCSARRRRWRRCGGPARCCSWRSRCGRWGAGCAPTASRA